MAIRKAIYEHLKTKKKYNTLLLKYESKCQEYDNKVNELNTSKRIRQIEKNKWEEEMNKYIEDNIALKETITELRRKLRKKKED